MQNFVLSFFLFTYNKELTLITLCIVMSCRENLDRQSLPNLLFKRTLDWGLTISKFLGFYSNTWHFLQGFQVPNKNRDWGYHQQVRNTDHDWGLTINRFLTHFMNLNTMLPFTTDNLTMILVKSNIVAGTLYFWKIVIFY